MRKILCFVAFLSFFLFAVLSNLGMQKAAEGNSGYVGGDSCKSCHEEVVTDFSLSIHGKSGNYGMQANCESCHGPGAGHASSGDKSAIINPSKLSGEKSSEGCMNCHAKSAHLKYWNGSVHATQEVGCTSCHKVHNNSGNDHLLKNRNEQEVCFTCHMEVRASMLKRSKHPMRDSSTSDTEGKMTCSSCHNVHGSQSEKLIAAKSFNDKCYECHTEKKAPVLWEHSPVKEDCLTCHSAHGSSNDKMLVTKVPRLCQQCHMQGRHQTGALGANSVFAFNRGCLNCHPMVHGSNHPSGTVLQR